MQGPSKKARSAPFPRGFVAVFDLETTDVINRSRGINRSERIRNLQISCLSVACIDSEKILQTYEPDSIVDDAIINTFWADLTHMDEEESVEGGFQDVLEMFDRAELIVGYNCISFDFEVLRKHYPPVSEWRFQLHLDKTHDIFARIRAETGVWFKLDVLLETNNLAQKSGDGLKAIKLFEEGRYKELRDYCEDDVKCTARLALLTEMRLPNTDRILTNPIFGVASALVHAREIWSYMNEQPEPEHEHNTDTEEAVETQKGEENTNQAQEEAVVESEAEQGSSGV